MDKLYDDGFIDVSNYKILFDCIFYIANSDMVTFFSAEFELPPEGIINHKITIKSFRAYPYHTKGDKVREVFEYIFAFFLIYYTILEFIKVYWQYSDVLKRLKKRDE